MAARLLQLIPSGTLSVLLLDATVFSAHREGGEYMKSLGDKSLTLNVS